MSVGPTRMLNSWHADPPFLCRYSEPEKFSIVQIPLPELRDDDILVKVKACGVCGTGKLRPLLVQYIPYGTSHAHIHVC